MKMTLDKFLGEPIRHDHIEVTDLVTFVNSYSADWENTFSVVSATSSKWNLTYDHLNASSAIWDLAYSTVATNSAQWDETAFITPLQAASGNWNSVFATVMANSAQWDETGDLNALSAQIAINTANIAALSGDYSYGDTIELVYTSINYTATEANISGHLQGIDNKTGTINTNLSVVQAKSANWENTWLSVAANSASWEESSFITPLQEASGSWNSAFNTSNALSAKWNLTYDEVDSSSGMWDQVYSNVNSNSSSWNLAFSKVRASSAIWDQNVTDLQNLSGTYSYIDIAEVAYSPTNYSASTSDVSGHLKGLNDRIVTAGVGGSRPTTSVTGYMYFDTTLGYPIWWDGLGNWINSTGASV